MQEQTLSRTEAVNLLLRSSSVTGSEVELARIARACALQVPILRLATKLLKEIGGDASRFFDDDVQMEMVSRLNLTNDQQLMRSYFSQRFSIHGLYRGEYRRGLQLTNIFERVGVSPQHLGLSHAEPSHEQALYALELGDLNASEATFRRLGFEPFAEGDYPRHYPALYQYAARQNLIDVLVLRGDLLEAKHIADTIILAYETEGRDVVDDDGQRQRYGYRSLETAVAALGEASGSNPYARRALVRALRGEVTSALGDFKAAERFQHDMVRRWYGDRKPLLDAIVFHRNDKERLLQAFDRAEKSENPPLPALTGQAALYYGVLLIRLGKLRSAMTVIDYNRRWAQHYLFRPMTARAHVYQSDIHRLMREYALAARYLELPMAWAAEAGHAEIHTLALLARARLHLAQGQLDEARSTAEEAHSLTEHHGFTLLRIDALMTRGHIAYQQALPDEAYHLGRDALQLAHPIECGYAWGHASALHLMGLTRHARRDARFPESQSQVESASYSLLRGAADIRERIRDPRLANTRSRLGDLPAPTED